MAITKSGCRKVSVAHGSAAERRFRAADNWDYQAGGCAQIIHSGVVHRPGDRRIMSAASRISAATWPNLGKL